MLDSDWIATSRTQRGNCSPCYHTSKYSAPRHSIAKSGAVRYAGGGKNEGTYERNSRHQQGRNEGSESTPLGPVIETVPSENIEIARPVHVTGIDLPSECVDEIIIHKHFVPRADEVY